MHSKHPHPTGLKLSLILVALGIIAAGFSALTPPPQPRKRIILEHADSLIYDRNVNPDARILVGNVRFRHDNATMECDKAHHYPASNSFEAFGRVYMNQADTIHLNANHLFYDGELRLAEFRDEVKLSKKGTTLYTDNLDYDRNTGMGEYFYGGTIVDSLNTLSSIFGRYDTNTDDAEFQDSVRLENPNFQLTTEILQYNTRSKIAHILGETLMKSDSGYIVSTRGIYDTERDLGILLDRSTIYSKDRILTGDSIYYDRKIKFGEAFGDMILTDTKNKSELHGQYGYFDESKNYAFATERAYLKEYSKPDTSYISADTLELVSYKEWPKPQIVHRSSSPYITKPNTSTTFDTADSIENPLQHSQNDSTTNLKAKNSVITETDTIYPIDSIDRRIVRGYHNVRMYRKDIQAIGDSLTYISADSLITFFGHPIVWNEQSQLSGDTLKAYLRNDSLDYATANGHAVGIRQLPDTTKFDQISADLLKAYFQDSTVRDLDASGKVETILFLEKKRKNHYSAFKRMTGPILQIHLDADTLQKAKWLGPTEGKVYPIRMAGSDTALLASFNWQIENRPQSPTDLFRDSIPRNYHRPSLTSLKRFSGAIAAMRAYDEIKRRVSPIGSSRTRSESVDTDSLNGLSQAILESPKSESNKPSELSPFIQKPLATGQGSAPLTPSNFIDLWLYSPFSNNVPPEGSTTNPSTGIQIKRNSKGV